MKADGSGDGTHGWSFNTPIPAEAKGSWTVALEARKDVKLAGRRDLERGYNNGTHVYDEVGFPGDLRACTTCHTSSATYQLPLASTRLPVTNPWDYITPAGRATGNCLACHDSKPAPAHAASNTSPTLGEACASCHGPNAEYSVDRLHA